MAKSKYDLPLNELRVLDSIKRLFDGINQAMNSANAERFSVTQKGMSFEASHIESNGKLKLNLKIDLDHSSYNDDGEMIFAVSNIKSYPGHYWGKYFSLSFNNAKSAPDPDTIGNLLKTIFDRKSDRLVEYYFNSKSAKKATKSWLEKVREYEELELPESYLPLEIKYAQEFFLELRLSDPKADKEPFPIKTQLALDAYLDDAIVITEQEQEATGEDYSEIIDAAKELKKTQTQITQNETLRMLSEIYAKARMKSISFLMKLIEGTTIAFIIEVAKKLLGA